MRIDYLFGRPTQQHWEDLELWEKVLNRFEGKLHWIIELGTFQGAMSYFLFAQAEARKMRFATYDLYRPEKPVPNFYVHDVLESNVFPPFYDYPQDYPGVLFCDNGNKPLEVATYHSEIHPESLIAVHDWGTEFLAKDIPNGYGTVFYSNTTIFLASHDVLHRNGLGTVQVIAK